jgi:hypothetical protein
VETPVPFYLRRLALATGESWLAGWLAGWLAKERCSREDCCKKRRGTSREERDKLRGVIRQAPYKRRTARSGVSQ